MQLNQVFKEIQQPFFYTKLFQKIIKIIIVEFNIKNFENISSSFLKVFLKFRSPKD